jgi:hypothetical protein
MKRIASVAALALTLLVAACSDVAVAPKATRQFSTVSDARGKVARWKNGPPQTDSYFASATIGPWGGRLSLAGFEVIVPPGAVGSNTNFTITLPAEAWSAGYVWASFGPHGMQFKLPVIIRAPVLGNRCRGTAGRARGLVRWQLVGSAAQRLHAGRQSFSFNQSLLGLWHGRARLHRK